ncbi:methionine sulfoxide reductase B [Mariprofundus ferrooxydans PV-1]|uniref:Methionine sulfoxide reductase B n=1 Tax=Mariprofundus ferrooxydans PV-1 TaxID=314345 RepID=Q0F202_9PROT|nr:methionine sulfoxide reductase B [Mariprofundus ferrooxydans PV-1]
MITAWHEGETRRVCPDNLADQLTMEVTAGMQRNSVLVTQVFTGLNG